MPSPKYKHGITAGLRTEREAGAVGTGGGWGCPWPAELPGLGRRGIGPYAPCSDCFSSRGGHPTYTWVRYGTTTICHWHMRERVARQEAAA
jgi:hypothetical protein